MQSGFSKGGRQSNSILEGVKKQERKQIGHRVYGFWRELRKKRCCTPYRAKTALPHKVGFATTSRNLVLLLPSPHASVSDQACRADTYKAGEANPVRVLLVAAGAFDAEGVEVGVLLSISGLEGSDAARRESELIRSSNRSCVMQLSCQYKIAYFDRCGGGGDGHWELERIAYPTSSAVRISESILHTEKSRSVVFPVCLTRKWKERRFSVAVRGMEGPAHVTRIDKNVHNNSQGYQ